MTWTDAPAGSETWTEKSRDVAIADIAIADLSVAGSGSGWNSTSSTTETWSGA